MELLLAEAPIKDHATLGSGAIVAGSGVTCDVPAGKTVLGYPC
jgi:UDP-3-O-[3-hydroxymyristoyl] glucosamine N-acyltransferase